MQFVRDGKTYMVAEGNDWFWKMFADGSWEPSTFKIFDKFLDKNRLFLDIGAWIGPTVLYAADKAREVFCFEPDPVAYSSLVQNLALNRLENVVPFPVAVAEKWKGIDFGKSGAYGDSMSSILWAKRGDAQVPAVSFEGLVIDMSPNFIKIDIEGGEKNIFDTSAVALSQIKPTIHLSLHTPWFREDVIGYQKHIMSGLNMYPFFYDKNFNQIELASAFNPNAFNSVIATFQKL